jgi:alpha-glucosidase
VIGVGLDQPHHDGSELYVERLGDVAALSMRAPAGGADAVLLRYVRDGEARTIQATIAEENEDEVWWRAEMPMRNPTVSYRWLLTGGRSGYTWLNGTGVHAHEVPPSDDFVMNAAGGGPAWHPSSVVYEIFIDRFASSGATHSLPAWAMPRDWNRIPDPHTRNPHREFYGGDLPGVEQRLDYIESLGVNAIYLSPFFPAESNHRFAASSFDVVDTLLGGDDALVSLVRSTHDRGMKLIGDLSLDHCGTEHEWFTRARRDGSSVERSFFHFDRTETHGYASWLGYKEMPRFDWRSNELRSRMSSMMRRWTELGLDGWRIDAAGAVGRYRDVDLNTEVARWARKELGDALALAEYWHDFRPDVDGLGWHGVMNYAGFMRPVWWWLRDETPAPDAYDVFSGAPAPWYDGGRAAAVMREFRAGIPWDATLNSWLLLDTHDTPRFGNVCGSLERRLVGVGMQMTSPGVPLVYAGAEIGLEGRSGYDSRRTMPWEHPDRWNQHLLAEYRRLVALRRGSDALARGGFRYVHAGDDAIAYLRETKSERLLCLAARATHSPVTVPFSTLETLYGSDADNGVLPEDGPAFHVWRIHD